MCGLSVAESRYIASRMRVFYSELLSRYEEEKYDESVYRALLGTYQLPERLDSSAIERALKWKYGKQDDEQPLKSRKHRQALAHIVGRLEEIRRLQEAEPQQVFEAPYTEGRAFISCAFVLHLIFPDRVPIIDQHTVRAARYFRADCGAGPGLRAVPNTFEEIQRLGKFVNHFSGVLGVTEREFDKFLMMFGKHVVPRGRRA